MIVSFSDYKYRKNVITFVAMNDRKLLNMELGRIRPEEYASLPLSGLVVVLDNVRSAYNVGSIFRTCDAFKVDLLCLCGICAVPPSAEIHKTAIGAELSVPWKKYASTMDAISTLKQQGYRIISVEQTCNALSLEQFTPGEGEKYALVFGNEVDGVDQSVVDESDGSLEIPQWGSKHSLNVSVSAGVVLWQMVYRRPHRPRR